MIRGTFILILFSFFNLAYAFEYRVVLIDGAIFLKNDSTEENTLILDASELGSGVDRVNVIERFYDINYQTDIITFQTYIERRKDKRYQVNCTDKTCKIGTSTYEKPKKSELQRVNFSGSRSLLRHRQRNMHEASATMCKRCNKDTFLVPLTREDGYTLYLCNPCLDFAIKRASRD